MQLYAPIHLDCVDALRASATEYLYSNWDKRQSRIFRVPLQVEWVCLLADELVSRGIPPPAVVNIFARGPRNRQVIHRDTFGPDWDVCSSALYLPLLNDGGKLVWFDPDQGESVHEETPAITNSNGIATKILRQVYTIPPVIGEYHGDELVVINTAVPHRAESTFGPRAALSIKLETYPDLFGLFNLKE